MNKEIEYYKNQKNELINLMKKNEKLEKSSNSINRQLKKFQKRHWDINKQIKNDKEIKNKIINYNKIISKEKKKRILKTIAYSLLVTSLTMLGKILTKNALAGIPLHTSLISFTMIESMIYYNNTYDIKKIKKENDINKLNKKINSFEDEEKNINEKINSIKDIKNKYFDKINENNKKIQSINKTLTYNNNENIVLEENNKLTR